MSDPSPIPTPLPAGEAGVKRPTSLWRNPSFTLMWTSTAASGFGDRMIMLAALALLGGMAQTADSAGTLASTQFFFFLPYLVFNLVGGWLADHLPRKWLLLGCDEARGLILLAAFLALGSASGSAVLDQAEFWKVYLVLSAIGAFAAMFNPTRNAIIPQIAPADQLQSANAVILVINVTASMVGMVVGTSLIIDPNAIATVRDGLLYGAVFFIISGFFFAFMRPASSKRLVQPRQRGLAQVIRYTFEHKRVAMLIGVNLMVWGSAALVSTGLMGVLKIHHNYESDALFKAYGLLSALMGVGMLVGAALVILLNTRRESSVVMTVGLLLAGLFTLTIAAVPFWPITLVASFSIGVFGNVAIISSVTLLQAISPNYIRGRIMGLMSLVATSFSICVYGAIWLVPNADYWVLVALLTVGPILLASGLIVLIRHLISGPMPNKMANLFWRLTRLFCFSWHGAHHFGKHHLPSDGPVVIASNHTTAMDPFLIQAGSIRMVRWLMLTAYRKPIGNFLWNAIDPICIEYNAKTGERGSPMKQVRQVVGELKKGDVVGMFPEGRLQYDHRELGEFEDGAAAVARLSGAVIVPCWIEGTVVSKSMLAHALVRTKSTVTFGPPLRPEQGQSAEAITAELRRRIVALGQAQAQRRAAS